MSFVIPQWLVAPQGGITTLTLVPLVPDVTGTLQPIYSASLLGQLHEISESDDPQMREISPIDTPGENWCYVKTNVSITMTEILKDQRGANIPQSSILKQFYFNYMYAYFYFARGGNSTDLFGIKAGFQENVTDEMSTFRMSLRQIALATDATTVYGTDPTTVPTILVPTMRRSA